MDLKKRRTNYQLKLFLPIVGLLWVIIIAVEVSQYKREKDYRAEMIRSRIEFMNQRLLSLMEEGIDPTAFLHFIDNYYKASELDNLSMTLYDTKTGQEKVRIGFPTPLPEQLSTRGKIDGAFISANNNDDSTYIQPDKAFYYSVNKSSDGSLLVQTFMPLNARIAAEIKGNPWLRFFVLLGCAGITLVTYIATRHLTKNIRLLREFVSNASSDHDFVAIDKFANDDLGEISRQVVNMYNMRKAALASRELEHRVALKATEERSNLKRQMTNNINHELKTPAGIIKGYIDTIIDNPDMDDESRNHFLLKTQEHIERLCNILNDLSTMTRLEDGAQNISLEKIDFKEFVDNIRNDVEESGINRDMTFSTDIPQNCYVKGNKHPPDRGCHEPGKERGRLLQGHGDVAETSYGEPAVLYVRIRRQRPGRTGGVDTDAVRAFLPCGQGTFAQSRRNGARTADRTQLAEHHRRFHIGEQRRARRPGICIHPTEMAYKAVGTR